jgi:ubiquinol-cytochrome c reductase cytochrome b subunit
MQLILAGWTIGPATLTRFYATHVFLLPALIFLFLAIHLYLVVRLGISETPRAGRPVDPKTYPSYYRRLLQRGEPFFPDSFWRDVVAALVVVLAILALAIFVGPPPLAEPPDPTIVEALPRPDWYFLWYFALLALVPKAAETLVILGFPVAIGIVLLAMPLLANRGERAPSRRPWAVFSVLFMVTAFVTLTWLGIQAPWSPLIAEYETLALPQSTLQGLNPQQQHGAELFNRYGCHACHAIGGVGGHFGPALDQAGQRYDRDFLVTTILRGRGNMPAYAGTIPPEDLDALLAFLETLGRQGPAPGGGAFR